MSTKHQPNNGRKAESVISALRQTSVMRSRDLIALGVSREYLRKLCDRGKVEPVGRGLYRLPGAQVSPRQTMIEASRRVPHGAIALLLRAQVP